MIFGEMVMTSGASGVGAGTLVTEMIQLRDASASEALAIFRAQVIAFRRRVAAVRGGRANRIALVILAGVITAVVMAAVDSPWMRDISPTILIPAAVLVMWGGGRIYQRYYYRRIAEVYGDCLKADRRFCVEDGALVVTDSSGVITSKKNPPQSSPIPIVPNATSGSL